MIEIDLGARRAGAADEERTRRSLAWEAPWLPGLRESTVPRWETGATWIPPGTKPLVRHRSDDGARVVVSHDRRAPEGFHIEFDLGVVHTHGELGARRLIMLPEGPTTIGYEGELADGLDDLGYVEAAPLPMLLALRVVLDPVSGQAIPVAGPADPMWERGEDLGLLGWIEGFPIEPRRALDLRNAWGLAPLLRTMDLTSWRHRYDRGPAAAAAPGDAVALGGLWTREPGPGLVALRRDAAGFLSTDLLPRPDASADPAAQARWVAAPLGWTDRRVRAWALRASAARARALGATTLRGPGPGAGAATVLGHLRRAPADGYTPLFSATHPALGDQFATRSEIEANDLGYRIDGVLGHIADALSTAGSGDVAREVPWGSRFGQRRRYVEGAVTPSGSANGDDQLPSRR